MSNDRYQRIWSKVAEIPYGKVASYGQIAKLAGFERQARQVGYALHQLPDGKKIPWHRVINARGEISFPVDSEPYQRQRDLLLAEGIVFIGRRIDMKDFGWNGKTTSLDEQLWRL